MHTSPNSTIKTLIFSPNLSKVSAFLQSWVYFPQSTEMHLRTFPSSPNHNFHSTFISSSSTRYSIPFPPTDLHFQRSCNSKFKTGFCSFLKMEFGSPIVLRNHGGLNEIRCEEGFTEKDDGFYIRRAVELAKKAIGCTSPNPMVGCVLVRDGKIVGEGFHPKAGQPHAEVFALRDAGGSAENATAYVSLEPCNHHGRTPPCTEALIRAKVKRVVVGMVDPNPIVASKGVERLRASGIDVTVGVEEELCKNLNEAYIHRMLTGKPFVTLRYSPSCQSQLLQEYDGIILSSASLTNKSVFSTSQEPRAKQPVQIVLARTLDSTLQLPLLTTDAATQVIIFTENNTVVNSETSQQGVETVVLDRLNLNAILDYCVQRGCCSMLLNLSGNHGEDLDEFVKEGLEQGLLQKVVMEVLPSSEESLEQQTLKKLGDLKKVQYKSSNEGVIVEGYF